MSKAYIDQGDELELVAEDIASVEVSGGRLRLKTLFGDSTEVDATIREIDLLGHRIVMVAVRDGGSLE